MSAVPASAITIDAELLAPKLGLSGTLVENIAPAAAAAPVNTDHHSLLDLVMTAAACDLAATTTVEDNTPETLTSRLRAHLQAVATQRLPITYQEAAKGLLLAPPNTIQQVTRALEQLMAEDAAAMRPFIAAMVISKVRGGLPAPGFFDCAARLGRFAGNATGPDAGVFHAVELSEAVDFWVPLGNGSMHCSTSGIHAIASDSRESD